ncbi:MAG: hypothetical protein PHW75_01840 [Patescibacteria group bacterium]|nr:hypothetical protein [Patescibacteria group bacterium]
MARMIILFVLGILMVIWLFGFGVYAYHVFSFGMPGDATKKSFYILLSLSLLSILAVTYVLSGVNWGALG